MRGGATFSVLLCGVLSGLTCAVEPANFNDQINQALKAQGQWPGVIRSDLGVTRRGTAIPCFISSDDLDLQTKKTRVLIVGGFSGEREALQTSLDALDWFYTSPDAQRFRQAFTVSAVPLVNPDDWVKQKLGGTEGRLSAEELRFAYPPKGDAYDSRQNPEAAYLWRWIGLHAPDVVVELRFGQTGFKRLANPQPDQGQTTSLAKALRQFAPANVGTIPAVTASIPRQPTAAGLVLKDVLTEIPEQQLTGPSPARQELQSRLNRTPLEIAEQLAKVYGQELNSVEYIPALALVGRLWLGELTENPKHRADVERIVSPYVKGEKPALPQKFSGSHLAGHLIFTELAKSTADPTQKNRYLQLACGASDVGFDEQGRPKEAMPAHNEMSDAVFMACPILAETAMQTGEGRYSQMALTHFELMRKLTKRADGIYRHSPLCETAWGRGNGFPALGLAWCLSVLPPEDPAFPQMQRAFQRHLAALIEHQDPTGTWHQVIDDSGSYREFTSTAMITFAMIRGVRRGWLEEATYQPLIEKAFDALKTRIASNGSLVDVCTGTGKQKTLRDYYDRKAILGPDARGGAMALLVTTEMARWQRERAARQN